MAPITPRRDFLRTASGGAAVLAGSMSGPKLSAAAKRTPVVDTHLHCFAGAADRRFPYHPRAPYRPKESATPENLLRCTDQAGVDHAVVIHPEPYQDDHRYLGHCLRVGKGRLKGTCLVFADRPGATAKMPALARELPLVAVRVYPYGPERLPPFGRPELRALWKQAGELGLAVQLHLEPRYAPRLEPYIKEFRDVRVMIDHLARPFQGIPEEHAVVVRRARYPNTVMKLSAIPSTTDYPHRDIGPVIKELVKAYGAGRLIYGGGFHSGATGESYRAARERARSYIAHLLAADQARVLGGTAARLFQFV